MAKRSELLYWTGSAWANARFRHYSSGAWGDNAATAGTDINPVKAASIDEALGNPRKATITIINRAKDAASTTAHEGRGRFTGAFTDFQNIRLRDGETGTILVSGKIYDLEEKYDNSLGNLIILTIRDNLEELRNFTTGAWVDLPKAYTTSSRISSDIVSLLDNVLYLDTDSINFEGTGKKYEASATVYDQAGSIEFKGNNNKLLKTVSKLSALDPHADGVTDTYGYDYYVDPAVITNATNVEALPDWNYFKRGTRPSTAPQTYGLTVKFPSTSFTEDGYTRRMHNDFEFNEPKSELYSEVSMTYHDKGVQTVGGLADDVTEEGEAEVVKTRKFERIDVSSISGSFTGLNYPFGSSELLTFTPTGGGATNFARFEYQSATSGSGFIIVSPLDSTPGSFGAAFPEAAGTITGATSSTTAATGASCRPAKNFGVRKTKTVTHTSIQDVQKLRQEVTSYLSRSTTVIKRGNYKVSNYPYHYIDAAADKVTRSSGTITFASAAFATNGGSASNNPELFGVKVGDVIAELNDSATAITRYAYISGTTSSTVVYGGNTAAETSDDTALDASKPMRIYIPLRAGHVIQTTNTMANVSGTHLVTEVHFNEDNGLSFTRLGSVGKNDSAAKLGFSEFEAVIEGAEKYGEDNVNKGTNIANVKSWTFTGTVSAIDGSDNPDADTIYWTAGKLYDDSGGLLYAIQAGNTGTLSAESIVYFDPKTHATAFQTSTRSSYEEKINRVKILSVKNTAVADGLQATFSYLTPVSGFSSLGTQSILAADVIANASMTSVLSKKGMQGWATDLIFEGTDWNAIKWHKVDASDSTNGNVSFSDDDNESVTYGTHTFTASSGAGSASELDKTVYCYKTVGDTPSGTLVFTNNYTDLYKDSRILLASFVLAASDDATNAPSIFPFNGSQPTISAGLISAGAITADNIQANTITAAQIAADQITANEIVAGAITSKHTITGATVQTSSSASEDRVVMTSTGIDVIASGTGSSVLDIFHRSSSTATQVGRIYSSANMWVLAGHNGSTTEARITIPAYGQTTGGHSAKVMFDGVAEFNNDVFMDDALTVVDTITSTANVVPASNGGASIGTSSLRWNTVYGQEILADDGSDTNPSIAFKDDTDTGIARDAVDTLALVAGGEAVNIKIATLTSGGHHYMGIYPNNEGDGNASDGSDGRPYVNLGTYPTTASGWNYQGNGFNGIVGYYHSVGQGSLAGPSLYYSGDVDTGIYFPAVAKIAMIAQGVEGLRLEYNSGATDDMDVIMHPNTTASGSGLQALYISASSKKVYRVTSSARYKERITDLELDSSKIYDLRPVSYREKKTHVGGIGLIAEEVEKIMPEIVAHSDDGTPEAVQYADLPILMLKEMKKLKEEIKSLKEKS